MDIKEKMLICHERQRNWLMEHHGMDEFVHSMIEFSANRAGSILNLIDRELRGLS